MNAQKQNLWVNGGDTFQLRHESWPLFSPSMFPRRFCQFLRTLPARTVRLALWFSLIPLGVVHAQESVIAVDLYNKKIHIESGGNVKRSVGGLAMIATSMVALDWADTTKVGVNVLATVSPQALQFAGGNELGLQPGDEITLRDLIYASMMASDAASATVLAEFVGNDILMRRSHRGNPFAEFTNQMNKLAGR